jgi:hypothetical protein
MFDERPGTFGLLNAPRRSAAQSKKPKKPARSKGSQQPKRSKGSKRLKHPQTATKKGPDLQDLNACLRLLERVGWVVRVPKDEGSNEPNLARVTREVRPTRHV